MITFTAHLEEIEFTPSSPAVPVVVIEHPLPKDGLFSLFYGAAGITAGTNWDAFSEVLRFWPELDHLTVVHHCLPFESRSRELQIYLRIIFDADLERADVAFSSFHIIFPESLRSEISRELGRLS